MTDILMVLFYAMRAATIVELLIWLVRSISSAPQNERFLRFWLGILLVGVFFLGLYLTRAASASDAGWSFLLLYFSWSLAALGSKSSNAATTLTSPTNRNGLQWLIGKQFSNRIREAQVRMTARQRAANEAGTTVLDVMKQEHKERAERNRR